jgi:hypothetical protein
MWQAAFANEENGVQSREGEVTLSHCRAQGSLHTLANYCTVCVISPTNLNVASLALPRFVLPKPRPRIVRIKHHEKVADVGLHRGIPLHSVPSSRRM